MKVSVELMKFYSGGAQWKLSQSELVAKIGQQLGAVEETIDYTPKYDGITIVEITEAKPHPNADKLNIYQAFDGKDTVQVVSGDVSLQVGDKVARIAPGQTVPITVGTDSPVTMESRPLRGEMSHGMFGSGKELGINDDHEGVLVLDTDAPAGTPLALAYDLNDSVIDIENKMFTHRPDGFGNLGVAREIAGIQGLEFKSPDWYSADAKLPVADNSDLKVTLGNEIPKLVPRFVMVPISGVTVGPSPIWLQSVLHKLGVRPINNIVDITNYFMVLTGQPLHAYDYDKMLALDPKAEQLDISVRHAKKGEKLTALNGKEIELVEGDMVVAVGDTPVCLGGVIGGENTAVDECTKNIVLEAATWDMYTIRRTIMRHGVFTDAATRFSKGQSPLQNVAVIAKAASDIKTLTGGQIAGKPIDDCHVSPAAVKFGSLRAPIKITSEFINTRLGSKLTGKEIATVLTNVECNVTERDGKLSVRPPFWRTDLEIPEDIVEEIGRLRGFDKLPHQLPTRATTAVNLDAMDELKNSIRSLLSGAGANELQTYSFVPAKLMESVGQDKAHSFAIRNAISPELQHYRLSLTPGLLEKVHANIKAGFDEFGLFEINKFHVKGDEDAEGLPREYQSLAFVFAAKKARPGAAFYQAKYYLDYLLNALHIDYTTEAVTQKPGVEIGRQVLAPFEPKRSGAVKVGETSDFIGFVGEYHAAARKALKLPDYIAGFEIGLERLLKNQRPNAYEPILRFPAIDQDITLRVKSEIAFSKPEALIKEALESDKRLRLTVKPLDIYQPEDKATHKNLTYRLTLQHHDRTLTTEEVNQLINNVVEKVATETGAERI